MAFNYFCKTLYFKSLRGSKYVSRFEYARVVNFQRYKWYTYFRKYDSVLNMCRGGIMEGFSVFPDPD